MRTRRTMVKMNKLASNLNIHGTSVIIFISNTTASVLTVLNKKIIVSVWDGRNKTTDQSILNISVD
jgi:hypothetical protein